MLMKLVRNDKVPEPIKKEIPKTYKSISKKSKKMEQ